MVSLYSSLACSVMGLAGAWNSPRHISSRHSFSRVKGSLRNALKAVVRQMRRLGVMTARLRTLI